MDVPGDLPVIELTAAPCPWCGATRIEASAYLNSINYKMWRAKCKNCAANGPSSHTPEIAMTLWSDRKTEPTEKIPEPAKIVPQENRTLDSCLQLSVLARRLVELTPCMCVDDLKCVPCMVRLILVERKN